MLINLTYACKMGCNHCLSDCVPDGENMSIRTLRDVNKVWHSNMVFFWWRDF